MGIAIVIITKTDGNCKGKSKFWEQDSKIFYYCGADANACRRHSVSVRRRIQQRNHTQNRAIRESPL
jgi:hypothetical protein